MTQFSRKDYETTAAMLRKESVEHPANEALSDLEFGRQECLESIVDSFAEIYRMDNRLFDENRFRMGALGYLVIGEGPVERSADERARGEG